MKIHLGQNLALLATLVLSLALTSCEKQQHGVSLKSDHKLGIKEGVERQPYFQGSLVFTKRLSQAASASGVAAPQVDSHDELIVKMNEVHRELMSIPEIRQFLTGNKVSDFPLLQARYNNLFKQLNARITHFKPQKVNGSVIQQTGELLMNVSVGFSTYFDLQNVSAKVMNMNLAIPHVESIDINIQSDLESEYLEATIAHELAHLYIESSYPALAHSSRKTGYGFHEGKAISEGAALCIEKIYLRHKYPEQKDGIFDRLHPSNRVNKATNDAEIPYGDYQRYFETVFTTRGKDNEIYLNLDYLTLRNYSISSDLVNTLAKTLSESEEINFTEWPKEYKICNYLSSAGSYEGGHVIFERGENTIEPYTEKSGLINTGSHALMQQIIKLESVALMLNNTAFGLKVNSIFTDGDSVPLIVREVTTVSDYKTQTHGRAFVQASGSSKKVIPVQGSSLPGLLYDARITCPTAATISISPEELKTGGYRNPDKLAILLLNARYMRESTLIHELSHLYLARLLPLLQQTDLREGHALYIEYLYLSKLFSEQLKQEHVRDGIAQSDMQRQGEADVLAQDFLKFKYQSSKSKQFERFNNFKTTCVTPEGQIKLQELQDKQNEDLEKILH